MNWKFWKKEKPKEKLRYKHVIQGYSANLDHDYKKVLNSPHNGEIIRLDTYQVRGCDFYCLTFWSDINNHWSTV